MDSMWRLFVMAFLLVQVGCSTESTLFPVNEPCLAQKLQLTVPEFQEIQTALAKKSDLSLRYIGRNRLGFIEAWMGYREELPRLTHGPVYIYEKTGDSWVQGSEMS